MSTIERSDRPEGVRLSAADPTVLAVFAISLFLSATLLFALQPMFAKMVLPLLGGSPSVWSVAMVFFQALLLAGYAYAHLLARFLDPLRAMVVHLCVFGIALFSLPIAVSDRFGAPPVDFPALWLIGLFGASIGIPYFAVAANAPLLQAWFATTKHPKAGDPYFLYGASNLGSFAALIAYPFLIEPFLTLRSQAASWSVGFVALMVMIAIAGPLALFWKGQTPAASNAVALDAHVTVHDRLVWVGLSFVPSALLIAVTSHISTDIAAAPFLWVLPLALYLATFVLTFRAGGDCTQAFLIRLQPYIVAPLAIGMMWGERAFWLVAIMLALGMFAVSTMICHRELYLRRPAASRLTEFYMWISVGGVLGGIATGLIAPFVFPDVWEYPILIVLALLCRPGALSVGREVWIRQGLPIAITVAALIAPRVLFGATIPADAALAWMIALILAAGAIMLQGTYPVRLVCLTAGALIITATYRPGTVQTETARSFFGVHKVAESYDRRFRMLFHGTTMHGAQRLRDESGALVGGAPEPLTYYYHRGPMAQTIQAFRAYKGKLNAVSVVGLGAGSLACYAKPGEAWTFYEIDPVVVRLAQDATKFRFLAECAPDATIVLGDARLTLAEAKQPADIIVLDAFSSDVVPAHLLTREALALYMSKLAPGGAVVFHISNRYLELANVVAAIAEANGLALAIRQDSIAAGADFEKDMYAGSLVAVVTRREEDLAPLRNLPGWGRLQRDPSVAAWTDDYSNVLAAMWRMRRSKQ
jgi:spermidine synthase